MNLYNTGSSTAFVPQTIITYNIPLTSSSSFLLDSAIFWGDVSSEFLIQKNGITVGGARTSASSQTVQVDYKSPLAFDSGDILTVSAEHSTQGVKNFKVNLIGRTI